MTDKLRSAAFRLRFRSESIVKRQRVEETLRKCETRYRTLIEASEDEIALKDSQGQYVLVNSAFAKTVGMPVDEIIGKTYLDIIAPEGRDAVRVGDLRVLNDGKTEEIEVDAPTTSGPRHFLVRKVPVRNEDGEVVGVLTIARDITERKRMEEALRESEERYRSLFDTAPVGYH